MVARDRARCERDEKPCTLVFARGFSHFPPTRFATQPMREPFRNKFRYLPALRLRRERFVLLNRSAIFTARCLGYVSRHEFIARHFAVAWNIFEADRPRARTSSAAFGPSALPRSGHRIIRFKRPSAGGQWRNQVERAKSYVPRTTSSGVLSALWSQSLCLAAGVR